MVYAAVHLNTNRYDIAEYMLGSNESNIKYNISGVFYNKKKTKVHGI